MNEFDNTTISSSKLSLSYVQDRTRFDEWKSSTGSKNEWDSLMNEIDAFGIKGLDRAESVKDDLLKENGFVYDTIGDLSVNKRNFNLDCIPFVLSENEFNFISDAVVQRMRLLNEVLSDCYGNQDLIRSGLIPPSLIFEQESFYRPLRHTLKKGENLLNFYAVDLARDEFGNWVVVKDHTHNPLGLGYSLENRIVTANVFSEFAKKENLVRLAQSFNDIQKSIQKNVPGGVDEPLVVYLSSKENNPSYFEDVFLSQYLGITLAEGSELTVRNDRVYLKSVSGLIRVHVIIRKIDETKIDPLFYPSSSYLGVPGLMQVARLGHVKILNPPGTGILENSNFYAYLPAISRQVLGEPLKLNSQHLNSVRPSCAPIWKDQKLESCPVVLRLFAFANGDKFQVITGGQARYNLESEPLEQAKDIWVIKGSNSQTNAEEDSSLLVNEQHIKRSAGLLSSKSADNLFWLGRYAERSEFATRTLLEIVLNITEEQSRNNHGAISPLLSLLEKKSFLLAEEIEELNKEGKREQLLKLVNGVFYELTDSTKKCSSDSICLSLKRLNNLVSISRSRLSNELPNIISKIEQLTLSQTSTDFTQLRKVLRDAIMYHSALNGTFLSNITRSRGWHFISLGKRIESAAWLIELTNEMLSDYPKVTDAMLESFLSINDTTLTYRFRYQSSPKLPCVLDLILFDPNNPRSLRTLLISIEDSLERLLTSSEELGKPALTAIKRALHFLETEFIDTSSEEVTVESITAVIEFVQTLSKELPKVAEKVGWEFFTHADYTSI